MPELKTKQKLITIVLSFLRFSLKTRRRLHGWKAASCCWAEHSQLSLSFKMWLNCFREKNHPKSLDAGYASKTVCILVKTDFHLFSLFHNFVIGIQQFPGKIQTFHIDDRFRYSR
jgi:hypothetical protein